MVTYSTVSAPGVDIYSTVGSNDYQVMDGTSMAAPIVTGTIALMKSLNENFNSRTNYLYFTRNRETS